MAQKNLQNSKLLNSELVGIVELINCAKDRVVKIFSEKLDGFKKISIWN